jgi:hypothetical protein
MEINMEANLELYYRKVYLKIDISNLQNIPIEALHNAIHSQKGISIVIHEGKN